VILTPKKMIVVGLVTTSINLMLIVGCIATTIALWSTAGGHRPMLFFMAFVAVLSTMTSRDRTGKPAGGLLGSLDLVIAGIQRKRAGK
jgi:hypothetical protein